jgi:hypothetical protein
VIPAEHGDIVDRRVGATRRAVWQTDALTALVTMAAGALAFVLVAGAVEHWVVPRGFDQPQRVGLLAVAMVAAVVYAARRLAPPLLRRVNPLYAARELERDAPHLKNTLVNTLELRGDAATHVAVRATVERQAADGLAAAPDATIDRTPLLRAATALAAVVLLAGLYSIVSPKNLWTTALRLAMPWAPIAAPSRVAITGIEPGSATLVQGETLAIAANVAGLVGDESMELVYSTDDGRFSDHRVAMRRASEGAAGDRYTHSLPEGGSPALGLQSSLRYRLEAGDARSIDFRVRVRASPTIAPVSVAYDFPAYTGYTDRAVEGVGDLRAVEGTRATIAAEANLDLRAASIDLNADGRGDVSMKIDGRRATGEVLLRFDRRGEPVATSYVLRMESIDGQQNRDPAKYRIETLADLAPEAALREPSTPTADVPLDRSLKIVAEARDPDFGLASVRLRGELGARQVLDVELLSKPTSGRGHRGKFVGESVVFPARLGLERGDVVACWIEATDIRTPEPKRGSSERLLLRIVGPIDQPRGQGEQGAGQPGAPGEQDSGQQGDPGQDGAEGQHGAEGEQGQASKPGAQGAAEGNQGKPGQEGPQRPGERGGPNTEQRPTPGADGQQQTGEQAQQGKEGQQGENRGDQSNGEGANADQQQGDQQQGDGSRGEGQQGAGGKAQQQPQGQGGQQQPGGIEGPGQQQGGQQREGGNANGASGDGKKPPQEGSQEGASSNGGNRPGEQPGAAGGDGSAGPGGTPQPGAQGERVKRPPGMPKGDSAAPVARDGSDDGAAFQRIKQYLDAVEKERQQRDGRGTGSKPEKIGNDPAHPNDALEQGGDNTRQPGATGAGSKPRDSKGPSPDRPADGSQQRTEQANDPAGRQSDSTNSESGTKATPGQPTKPDAGPREGTGDSGQNQAADQGGGQAGDQGAGERSGQPGGQQLADGQTGRSSGNTPGAGSESRPSGSESTPGEGAPEGASDQSTDESRTGGEGAPSRSAANGSTKPDGGQQGAQDGPAKDQGQPQGSAIGGGDSGSTAQGGDGSGQKRPPTPSEAAEGASGDKANLDYARRQTDLVLDRLANQLDRKSADRALLEKLGWTEDDLRRFVERWNARKQAAGQGDPERAAELDEALRSLGLADERPLVTGPLERDKQRDFRERARTAVPPALRERLEAYNRGVTSDTQ